MEKKGRVWLKTDAGSMGKGRVLLLEKIDETGSISKAAKAMGMSYKAAWSAIEKLNNMFDEPLVVKSTGGKKGGGSFITESAKKIIASYYDIEEKQSNALNSDNETEAYTFFEAGTKNLFAGTVSSIIHGQVSATVGVSLRGNDAVVAVITKESLRRMELEKGNRVYALVSESSITLFKGDASEILSSARNRLVGKIKTIDTAGISSEIVLELSGGQTIHLMITAESLENMELYEGCTATAAFKASSVILLK